LEELVIVAGQHMVVYPMELVGRVVVDDGPARCTEHELPPVFEGQLVRLVHKQDVSLASPDLLRLVHGDELHHVPKEDVCSLALIVGDGEYCAAVFVAVAQLNESREDGVRLA
jgi:hypothetical protein